MRRARSMPLFWQVVLTNGLVFVLGTLVLALSPATVSERVRTTEALVLASGLTVIVAVNALLLRRLLAPLDRLTATMRAIDLRSPGLRLEEPSGSPVAPLVDGFNDMVRRLEEERSSSTARALSAQEAERRRIAQELHDEVGQSLTVVLLGLAQVRGHVVAPEAARTVESLQEGTRDALEEVRRIAQRLRPGVLDDLGLLNSLSGLATELTETAGIRVVKGFAPGLPEVPPATELVVYRVAQEALTNVARHAQASSVELGLTRRGAVLELRVADDGRGPGTGEGHPEGAGIQGMRERAQLVGGSLAVTRREGGGTVVRLAVPLPADGTP